MRLGHLATDPCRIAHTGWWRCPTRCIALAKRSCPPKRTRALRGLARARVRARGPQDSAMRERFVHEGVARSVCTSGGPCMWLSGGLTIPGKSSLAKMRCTNMRWNMRHIKYNLLRRKLNVFIFIVYIRFLKKRRYVTNCIDRSQIGSTYTIKYYF